ncbi:flavin reductase family protein [Chondrinema litorale]|uniref:flavin reductase family protein n=1 Tax=Chondrinema litorale TaxID=2994555 RepID=UPI0025430E51|nr:flavin reductase family protein [Chondrinema litorale]UZR97956.1 flavin reductase family protein [Chondrinema litorale]
MKTIDPTSLNTAAFHSYMLGVVAPRPIAFASTIDKAGNVNLSPFSFFNAFSSNPPVLVFSSSRRVRDNTTKHTLENLKEVPEVVINVVNYAIVEQMSLSSTEYQKGINEFEKSGLQQVDSVKVKPPRVGEAPAAFECKVNDIISLGEEGGAGNLIICEVVMAHFQEKIFDKQGKVDPFKLDAVARMGGNWYCRAQGEALFEIPKPLREIGIGVDQIPESVRNSMVLTGNHLGRLGNIAVLPTEEEVKTYSQTAAMLEFRKRFVNDEPSMQHHLHQEARELLDEGKTKEAWLVLLQSI